MKVAPILRVLAGSGDDVVLVHTGQHYDAQMSGAFFDDLGIPAPDRYLGVGSASHAVQTARVMEAFEPVLLDTRPDWVVVVGDVNSTLACALVAAKLKPELGCRVAHVEAGLRSRDWRMPEEINRVLTDQISDLLLVPSRDAIGNLLREGVPEHRIVFAGNVMIDTLLHEIATARKLNVIERMGLPRRGYAIVTLHRPSNVDDRDALEPILRALADLATRMPVVFPMHPRTRKQVDEFALVDLLAGVRVLEPLGYRDMMCLVDGAALTLTDSGGLQEETTVLGIPCVTLREQTERPITVSHGTNRMAPWPLTKRGITRAVDEALAASREACRPEGWDGRAAERVVAALRGHPAPTPAEHDSHAPRVEAVGRAAGPLRS